MGDYKMWGDVIKSGLPAAVLRVRGHRCYLCRSERT